MIDAAFLERLRYPIKSHSAVPSFQQHKSYIQYFVEIFVK